MDQFLIDQTILQKLLQLKPEQAEAEYDKYLEQEFMLATGVIDKYLLDNGVTRDRLDKYFEASITTMQAESATESADQGAGGLVKRFNNYR